MNLIKKIFTAATVLLLLGIAIASGQSYDLRFDLVSMDGSTLVVTVQIKASSTFPLGTSTLIFTFDDAAMTYSSFSPLNFSGGNYKTMTKSGVNPKDVSLNIELNTTPGTTVITSWMDVAQVTFTILNPDGISHLHWDITGTVVYNENDTPPEMTKGTFTDLDTTLPVELSSFTAEMVNGVVEIKWITESEKDNLYFHILRSSEKDGDYLPIPPRIEGAKNSTQKREYRFIDDRLLENNKTYYYKIKDEDINGNSNYYGPIEITAINVKPPEDYYLYQNFPNPFNIETSIQYGLPEAAQVKLQIFNLRGELVRTIIDEYQQAGHYLKAGAWDGKSDLGYTMPSGIYIYRMVAGSYRSVRKMLLTK